VRTACLPALRITRDLRDGMVVSSLEPSPGADPGSQSIPRTGGRRSEGRELGNVDSNHDCWGQGPADCHYLIPIESRPPVPIQASPLTGGRSQPCAAALCAREDLNLHSPRGPQRPQHCASTCSATGTLEPPPGADPGHPPYEGGAAAVRGGVSCPARTRTSIA
jgi:hypothetical protein